MAHQRIPIQTAVRASTVWSLFDLVYDTDLQTYYLGDSLTVGGVALGGNIDAISAPELLTTLKTVDGLASGLDADFFQGMTPLDFASASHTHSADDMLSGVLDGGFP